jgi:hypothetical protein
MNDKITAFLEEMIEILTFRRVALLTLLGAIFISLFAIFEHRDSLFAAAYKQIHSNNAIIWGISIDSKNDVAQLARFGSGLVSAVSVTDVDLRKNRKALKYFTSANPEIEALVRTIPETTHPISLFDYDQKNIEQMVSMLNNEFVCVNVADVDSRIKFFDKFKVQSVCRIAVPPYFGEFAGFITIYLSRIPTFDEVESLKMEAAKTSIQIYLIDISKKS